MSEYIISADSDAGDLVGIALTIHDIINRLPVTARSLNNPGVRIENGMVIDDAYTGPVLEIAMRKNHLIKTVPKSGPYANVPVVVAPVHDKDGEVIAAIGLVDITGIFDLATLMEHQSTILKQVCGKDPCPLPTEAVAAKK
ncbi:DUF2111 domain-containing protein [Methanogenium organophilum]|uniref:DUF2111 domain-containing protein n=1 Tax=Methanogenium organophilum TaxID=2199 RepID=A0A9X9T7W9_METOG|nr:DUF2111 domain-containing protein [Methanogenium organophilum]WAI01539.1 DUF2111 domain-containing protein [Methanogenium organophilum]